MEQLSMRQAQRSDVQQICAIGLETVEWTRELGIHMWDVGMFDEAAIAADVDAGLFWLALHEDIAVAMLKFELEDKFFWPEMPKGDSAYLHRLAVRREFAGRGVSHFMLHWAVQHARNSGLRFLRLDCLHDRQPLRDMYEKFGFRYCGPKQAGPYFVARYEYLL